MSTRIRRALIACLVAVSASAGWNASAHRPADVYTSKYPRAFDDVNFYFHKSVPPGQRRGRIVDGARRWNRFHRRLFFRAHRKPVFEEAIGRQGNCNRREVRSAPPGQEPASRVYWTRIDGASMPTGAGKTLALNYTCQEAKKQNGFRRAIFFQMYFDEAEPWYYRSRTGNAPSGRPDLLSVAAHEMGHATGWRFHYDDRQVDGPTSPVCREDGGKQTMCSTNTAGTERQRSLGAHDKHTFRSAYP